MKTLVCLSILLLAHLLVLPAQADELIGPEIANVIAKVKGIYQGEYDSCQSESADGYMSTTFSGTLEGVGIEFIGLFRTSKPPVGPYCLLTHGPKCAKLLEYIGLLAKAARDPNPWNTSGVIDGWVYSGKSFSTDDGETWNVTHGLMVEYQERNYCAGTSEVNTNAIQWMKTQNQ